MILKPERERERGELMPRRLCLSHFNLFVSYYDFFPIPQAFPIQNRNRDNATVQYCNPRIHNGIWLCLLATYSATT